MSDNSLESRVATLEERARAQSELNHAVTVKLDLIAGGIARLETASALSAARTCPAPGKCLELAGVTERAADQIRALDERLKVLETAAAEARGGWKVMALIAGVAGTVGSAIGWLVSHFGGKGKL
jgi:uncharacterized coiled-coil protein SlyX